jgi:hypothetical protein
MNRNRLSMVLATALLGSVALVGCKKKEEPVVTPPAAEAPAPMSAEPAPAPVAATTVNSVDLGNTIGADNKIATPNATFATKDPVYASVTTDGPNAGKLAAKWTFQDGQVVHEETKDIPAGPQVTQFQITKPDGWPVGKYKLEVMLDGAVVQTREFEVR